MHKRYLLVLSALFFSAVAFGFQQDGYYQVGYAANLNVGDTVINLTNDGSEQVFDGCPESRLGLSPDNNECDALPGPAPNAISNKSAANRAVFKKPVASAPHRQKRTFFVPGLNPTVGNICVNTYVFDPQEEEIGCCACLVTPNGLNSLSVKSDLISNNLTSSVPTSTVIKLLGSTPAQDPAGNFTLCDPTAVSTNNLAFGAMAWGATLEPNSTTGTYGVVSFPFLQGNLSTPFNFGSGDELTALTSVCTFIEANGSGFGICKSCRLGALAGSKQ